MNRLLSLVISASCCLGFFSASQAQMVDSIVGYYFSAEVDSVLYQKNVFQYDSNGELVVWSVYDWDTRKDNWQPDFVENYRRNSLGIITEIIHVSWNTGVWENQWKQEQSYDEAGNLTLLTYYNWDSAAGAWVRYWKQEQAYDSGGNIILWAHYDWYSETNMWLGNYMYTYHYNENSQLAYYAYLVWDWSQGDWKLSTKEFFYYSGSSAAKNTMQDKISLFPNPTSGVLHMKGCTSPVTVRIYNLHGKLLEVYPRQQTSIDLSSLPHGMYYIDLIELQGSRTRKMIIKN